MKRLLFVLLLPGCFDMSSLNACGEACGRNRLVVYTEETITGAQTGNNSCCGTANTIRKICQCAGSSPDAGEVDAGLKVEKDPTP
jgi:hypothetical protein